jgi:predicted nucleic acid-binding protein
LTGGVAYLIDTNVISEIRRVRVDAGVEAFFDATSAGDLFLSVLTIGELRKGVAKQRRGNPIFASRLGIWVDGLEAMFADRILPVDLGVARRWSELDAQRTLPVVDALIAATAIERGLTLVTRNVGDVAETGVLFVDPWAATA